MRSTSTIFFPFVLLLIFLLTPILTINGQGVFLESTLLRCTDQTDAPNRNPVQLATSSKSGTLDLKVYSKCRKKLMITLRVPQSPNEFVPDAVILVNKAMNSLTQKPAHFGLPIGVKLRQDKILQKFPLQFLYRVNGKMYEEVINSENSKNFMVCDNSPQATSPTCGFLSGSGHQVAGFCCTCKDHRNNVQQRGGQRCDTPNRTDEQLTSAHCLRFSPYSYNVYEFKAPLLYQKLMLEVFQSNESSNGSISWNPMSGSKTGVAVDSDNPMNASQAVKVTFRPHSEGVGQSLISLNPADQRLLIPTLNPYIQPEDLPEPFKGTLEDQILIVPKRMLSPRGTHCDLVGTRIDAFVAQPEPCRQQRNFCLGNQPFDLWKQDQGPNGDPKSKFKLKGFGHANPTQPISFSDNYETGSLFMEHKAEAPSYVDIEIPADDVIVINPGYNAAIEFVVSDTGMEGVKIITHVLNKEPVPAKYSLDLVHCSINITKNVTTSRKNIGPLNSKLFHLDVHSYQVGQPAVCYVALKNEYDESIAAREVTLQPLDTCICVHTCKCACGKKEKLKCVRLSDDNIVAAGLASEIETPEKLAAEEQFAFHKRAEWFFHVIVICSSIVMALVLFGALKAIIGLLCCRPFALWGLGYFRRFDDSSQQGPPKTDEVVCQNLSFFFCLPMILCWMAKPKSKDKSLEEYDGSDEEDEEIFGETDVDIVNISRISEGSDVTLYDRNENSSTVQLAGSQSSVKSSPRSITSKVDTGRTKSWMDIMSTIEKKAETPSTPQIRPKLHEMRSLAGPGTGISERTFVVKSESDRNPIHLPGAGGPQAVQSVDSQLNNNDASSVVNLCNMISASSSKSSFGTWHRRRKDQCSAYDFLPEPKQKGSFS